MSTIVGADADVQSEAERYPAPRSAWFALGLILIVYTCSFIDRQLLSILVQPIKQDIGLSDTQISLLHGFAFALFFSTFGLPLGTVADRSNRRNLIIFGLIIWSISTAFSGLAHSFGALFVARIVVGAAEACLSPAAYSLIADYFHPKARARAIALYASGAYLGAGMGYLAGGQIVVAAEKAITAFRLEGIAPWQLSFITAGLAGLLLPPVILLLKEPTRKARLRPLDAPLTIKDGLNFIARRKGFYSPFLTTLCITSIINYNFFAWTPTLLQRQLAFTLPQSGFAFGMILLIFGPAGMVLAGLLLDRVKARRREGQALRVCALATLLALPFALLATLSQNVNLALIGFAGTIFFVAVIVPLGPFVVQATSPNEFRGFASSFYILVLNIIGLGFGPTISASLADGLGISLSSAIAWIAIATMPVSAWLFLVAARRVSLIESYE